jgi:hypothetical protein
VLLVLFVVALAVAGWARWLVGDRRTPRWVRAVAPIVGLATIVTGVYALWALRQLSETVRETNPAERQQLLASRIADAYTVLAIGWGAAAIAVAVLTVVTLRRRRSA